VLIWGLDLNYEELIVADMGKTLRKAEMLYVDPDRLELLVQLARQMSIPRSVLWRQALDDLLIKHGALEAKQRTSTP
jgi:Ribbon-helix-helix domain